MTLPRPISLLELNNRLARAVSSAPGLQNVWVIAETSDLRIAGSHCYLELIDKDPDSGNARARMRATIWSSNFNRINAAFFAATGTNLASNIKIMACITVTFHPVYGLSGNITDVDPDYTLGDILRRRREMIARLEQEGIINLNRSIPWPSFPARVAIVSAEGAAGYGDFINQLFSNRHNLRFSSKLFPASMQGDNTVPSIISALTEIAGQDDSFDCVVIIRGGGASGDLAAFDNYDLAAHIALFPLPVIVGIGHERDVTLLDYVANTRVKTPTAAAEFLIDKGLNALLSLRNMASALLDATSARLSSAARRLEGISAQIPLALNNIIAQNRLRIGKNIDDFIIHQTGAIIRRNSENLKAFETIIDTLSPQATLRRGFSITRFDGKAIKNPVEVPSGAVIHTTLASGILITTKP